MAMTIVGLTNLLLQVRPGSSDSSSQFSLILKVLLCVFSLRVFTFPPYQEQRQKPCGL